MTDALVMNLETRRDTAGNGKRDLYAPAVVILAFDYTFTFLNPRAQELLSVKGDLIGRNLWEEFPTPETGSFFKLIHRAMADRIPTEFEDFYPEPLNLWLNIQCRPSDDGIVVFFRDATSERTAHRALLDQQARDDRSDVSRRSFDSEHYLHISRRNGRDSAARGAGILLPEGKGRHFDVCRSRMGRALG